MWTEMRISTDRTKAGLDASWILFVGQRRLGHGAGVAHPVDRLAGRGVRGKTLADCAKLAAAITLRARLSRQS
eukprot:9108710-Lingulodinium_polyedra.AAC.1